MPLNDTLQALVDAGDWGGVAGYYGAALHLPALAPSLTADETALLKMAALLGAAYIGKRMMRRPRPACIPLELGPVTVDLQPTARDTIHTVIGGTSGLGKSTSVLPLLDLDIGVLVVALDNTRPIAEYIRSLPDGIEWTNEEGSPGYGLGLDLLSGKPAVAAEVLVAGWAAKTSADTGKWRDIASDRLRKAIARLDALGVGRNFSDLVLALLAGSGDAEADRACRDWARRLAILADTLGPALGPDLELVQAMRDRRKVLLRLNRFMHPRLAPMLGGMLLVHARRVMQEAGVPFVLVVEEAGQLETYAEHMSPIFQAGRDRGCPVVLLTQNARRLALEVQNNVSVWVSFAQEARLELDFAAERVRVEPEQLQREAFKDEARGWCYVRAPGVSTRLVRVKQRKPARSSPVLPVVVAGSSAGSGSRTVVDAAWRVVERVQMDGWQPWQPWPPMLPEMRHTRASEPVPEWVLSDSDLTRIWQATRRDGTPCIQRTGVACPLWEPERGLWWDERGCLEWWGLANADGRGRASMGKRSNGKSRDVTVYREFYRARFGIYPEPTYDHWCGNPRCVDPEHGGPCSIPENNARRAPREAAFMAARSAVGESRRVPA